MKKFVIACFMLLPTWAHSQISCAPREVAIKSLLNRYGERQQAIGLGNNGSFMEQYANTVTGSWTTVVTTPDGQTCAILSGNNYENTWEPLGEDM